MKNIKLYYNIYIDIYERNLTDSIPTIGGESKKNKNTTICIYLSYYQINI